MSASSSSKDDVACRTESQAQMQIAFSRVLFFLASAQASLLCGKPLCFILRLPPTHSSTEGTYCIRKTRQIEAIVENLGPDVEEPVL